MKILYIDLSKKLIATLLLMMALYCSQGQPLLTPSNTAITENFSGYESNAVLPANWATSSTADIGNNFAITTLANYGNDNTSNLSSVNANKDKTITSSTFITVAVDGDYRTIGSGTWLNNSALPAIWQRQVLGVWTNSNSPDYATTNSVYIQAGHTITTGGAFGSGVKLKIESAGAFINAHSSIAASIYVYDGGTLTLNNFLRNNGIFDLENNANFIINYPATGVSLIWAGTENFRPASNTIIKNWNPGAGTPEILTTTNITTNAYNGYTAAFGNLIFDFNANPGRNIDIIASGVTANLAHGKVQFITSPTFGGTARVINVGAVGNITSGIGGDFLVNSTYTGSDVIQFKTKDILNFTIKGNVQIDAANVVIMSGNSAGSISTVNIDGNLNITANGVLELNSTSPNSPLAIVNLKGDVTVAATSLLYSSNANNLSKFNFTGTGDGLTAATTQTIDIASTSAIENRYINFATKSGAYVQQINRNFELGLNSGVIVETGSVFDFGFNGTTALLTNISGAQTGTYFTSQTGSTLKITSPNGITTTALVGNAQVVASNRTYSQTATFHYIGKVNQVTGNAITVGGTAKNIICDLLDNTKELTFTNSTSITTPGNLDIRVGRVIESTTALITGSTGLLNMSSGTYYKIVKGNNTAALSDADLIPRLSGAYNLVGGTIELDNAASADAFQTLRGTRTYNNVTFNGANTLGTNFKNLSSNAVINNMLSVSGTAIVDCSDGTTNPRSFTGTAGITMAGGRIRFLNRTTPQPELTGTATAYALTGGVMEFYTNKPGGLQSIKGVDGNSAPIEYNQIEVTGSAVGNSNANITLRSAGTFTVKPTGVFEINDDAIVGPSGAQTVTVETGGVFKTGDVEGFAGGTVTSVKNDIENLVLQSGSTVEYSKATGVAQIITNAGVTSPSTANYYNFAISGSGNKTAPSGNLTIAGNIASAGTATYIHNSGTLITNGTAGQTFTSATPFNIYKYTNSSTATGGGFTVNSNLIIENEIALSSLSKINLNNGDVTLKSDASSTAVLRSVPNEAGIITYPGTGRFEIQRYLPAQKSWRLLATPVVTGAASPTITAAWREGGALFSSTGMGTRVTGADGPFQTYGPAYVGAYLDEYTIRSSMKSYNMNTNYFVDVLGIDIQTGKKIANDDGYFLFVRGDRSAATNVILGASTTLRMKGEVRTGTQTFPVTANKFRSIGNPFPSRLDMRTVQFNNVSRSYYAWDPNPVGSFFVGKYVLYLDEYAPPAINTHSFNLVPANQPNLPNLRNYIESGEAFFVQNSTASAGSVVIAEADKAIGNTPYVSRPGVTTATLEINLHTPDATGNNMIVDGAKINFNNIFNNGIDALDVIKIFNTADNLCIKSAGTSLIVERRKMLQDADTIQLNISAMRTANFTLEIDPSVISNAGVTAVLKDRFLQTTTPVDLSDVTNYNFTTTADANSKVANRFYIVFKAVPSTILAGIAAVRKPNNTIAVKWDVQNETFTNNYELQHSNDGINFSSIATKIALANNNTNLAYTHTDAAATPNNNWYRVKLNPTNGPAFYSAVAMVSKINEKENVLENAITITPNIITNNQLSLNCINQKIGVCAVSINNAMGQNIFNASIKITSNNETIKIALPKNIAAGKYNCVLQPMGEEKKVVSFLVQ
jgi:hypothetical protein